MSNILEQPLTDLNILPYSIAATDNEIANARYTLYKLKQAKNLLQHQESFKNTRNRSPFADISQTSTMPPLLGPDSSTNFILSERTASDANTYIQPFNNTVGLMDDSLNMQKTAFAMYLKLQNDKLNNLNTQLTKLEKQKQALNTSKKSYPIKSIKNIAYPVTMNVDEYTSRGISTSNYEVPYTKLHQSGSPSNACMDVDNSASNYYLLYGNRGCLSYDNPKSNYTFQPCNANDPMQQFFVNPVNNLCDYNNFASDTLKSASSIKMGFNVITPSTNDKQCLTTYPDSKVTIEPCTLSSNQRFHTYSKNIL
jgi:hypothetical protein